MLELNSTTNDCRKACTRKYAEERDEDKDENQSDDEDEGESETEYHASDTVCAVAADQNSFDPFISFTLLALMLPNLTSWMILIT